MLSAERQSNWLASVVIDERKDLPVILLGKAFKENTNLDVSGAVYLLKECLEDRGVTIQDHIDPYIDDIGAEIRLSEPACYVLYTKHKCFYELDFPAGSVVIHAQI